MKNEMKTGIILNYLNIVIGGILVFLVEPFIIKKLGQTTYGVYTLVSSFTNCLTLFELGIGTTIIHYISKINVEKKENQKQEFFSMIFLIYAIIILIIAISSVILYNFIDTIFKVSLTLEQIILAKKIFIIIAINVGITVLNSLFSSILNGYEKFTINRILVLFSTILNCILTLLALIINPTVLILTMVSVLISLFLLITNIIYIIIKLKVKIKINRKWNKTLFKEIFKFSIFVFLQTLISQIYWRLDQIIIGAMIPNSAVALAIYAVAIKINDLVLTFTTVTNRYQLPYITKIILKEKNNIKLIEHLGKVSRLNSIIYIAIIIGFCFFGKQFIILYAGKDYILAYPIILIFIISSALNRIYGSLNDVFKVKKLNGIYTVVTFFTACFNILLTIILIPRMGIIGAAIGTAISLIIGNTICPFILLKSKIDIGIKELFKNTFKGFGFVIIFSSLCALTLNILFDNFVIMYFLKCIIFVLIYLFLIYHFVLRKEEKKYIMKKIGVLYGILFRK